MVRRIARPMLAAWYIAAGWDAARHPAEHVARIAQRWSELAEKVDDVPEPDLRYLPSLVRLHGAAMVVAGVALALGRTPRAAGLALAGLSAPLLALDQPWLPKVPRSDRAERAERTERTLRHSAMVGAALIVAADLEGRPGVSWRVERMRAERAASRAERATSRAET